VLEGPPAERSSRARTGVGFARDLSGAGFPVIFGSVSVELTEKLLSEAAGWEVMKMARAYLQQGQVLSSYWAPPLLRGVLQAGEISFRASMVIKSSIDIENLCTCRDAREWEKSVPMAWPSACIG